MNKLIIINRINDGYPIERQILEHVESSQSYTTIPSTVFAPKQALRVLITQNIIVFKKKSLVGIPPVRLDLTPTKVTIGFPDRTMTASVVWHYQLLLLSFGIKGFPIALAMKTITITITMTTRIICFEDYVPYMKYAPSIIGLAKILYRIKDRKLFVTFSGSIIYLLYSKLFL